MESIVIPVFLFVGCAAVLAVGLLVLGSLVGPKRSGAVKEMPYECGMDPFHDTRRRFDVRFYLVAVAFLIFDVELLFLYPWAVASKSPQGIDAVVSVSQAAGTGFNRAIVFGEVMVFIALLAVGLIYAWLRGVFQWR